jgi:RNA-directed DNA polymerase
VDRAKPFDIPKREVWEAYKRVKANQGAAGVDGQTIADFEVDLSNNLTSTSSGIECRPAATFRHR